MPMSTPDPQSTGESTVSRQQALVGRVIVAGWLLVALSAVFLYLSRPAPAGQPPRDVLWWAVALMAARLCGIGSFAIGCVAVYNQRWTHGVALLLLSVVLPAIAFHLHGTF